MLDNVASAPGAVYNKPSCSGDALVGEEEPATGKSRGGCLNATNVGPWHLGRSFMLRRQKIWWIAEMVDEKLWRRSSWGLLRLHATTSCHGRLFRTGSVFAGAVYCGESSDPYLAS